MQLKTYLSLPAAALLLSAISAQAEDYVSVQYLNYSESDDRTTVSAPSIEINKDFGTDYTLNVQATSDSVSGASPTYYDASSGPSAYSRGQDIDPDDIEFGNIDYKEERMAGSALLTTRFDNRDELKTGVALSYEHDFRSIEGSADYMHWLDSSKNQSISLGFAYQSNQSLVECDYSDACDGTSGASAALDSDVITTQASFMQVIDQDSYIKASLFYIAEDGYLGSPYHNVVRENTDNTLDVLHEVRPDTRTAYGASAKYARALSDAVALHVGYRYYSDDWEIDSHTIDTEIYYEFGDFMINAGLRYYMQSEASFYSPDYFSADKQYATSDERLSDLDAIDYKLHAYYDVTEDVTVNLGGSFYDQSTGLSAVSIVAGVRYSF